MGGRRGLNIVIDTGRAMREKSETIFNIRDIILVIKGWNHFYIGKLTGSKGLVIK